MNKEIKVGGKATVKYTGEVITIRKIVHAAYDCYYFFHSDGKESVGYYTKDDLIFQ